MSKKIMAKRIIASSLALTMMVSAVAPTAFAEEGYIPVVNSSEQTTDTNNTDETTSINEATSSDEATESIEVSTPTTNPGRVEGTTTYVDDNVIVTGASDGEIPAEPQTFSTRALTSTNIIGQFPSSTLPNANTVNAANLNDWFVSDTNYSGEDQASWESGINVNGLHPFFKHHDGTGTGTVYTNLTYTPSTANDAFLTDIFAYRQTRNSNHHIIVSGNENDAKLTFAGYGIVDFVNFALANVTETDLKAAAFDIDPKAIDSHTINNYGIALNAKIISSGGTSTFYGYYLAADMAGNLRLVDLTGGFNVTKDQSTGQMGNQLRAKVASAPVVGSLASGKKFHLDLDIEDTSLGIKVAYYDASGTLGAYTINKSEPLKPVPGGTAFGPMVGFIDHGCSSNSFVQFSNMKLSVGYEMNFYRNEDSSDPRAQKLLTLTRFGKNKSLDQMKAEKGVDSNGNAYAVPATPTRAGYRFTGWSYDANGTSVFNPAQGLTGITEVYAKWEALAPPTIVITGNATNWTNQNVILNYDVNSKSGLGMVSSTQNSDPAITTDAAGNTNFHPVTGIVFEGNGTLKVDAEVNYSDDKNTAGTLASTSSVLVDYIDKTAPEFSFVPIPNGTVVTTINEITSKASYIDVGDTGQKSKTPIRDGRTSDTVSGINESTSIFVLFDSKGNIVKQAPISRVSSLDLSDVKGGAYYFDYVIVDNAGNMTDSYGNKYDTSGKPGTTIPTGKTPEDITKENIKKNDPTKPDHKVVINAGKPVITLTPPINDKNGYYSSSTPADVNYKVESDVPLDELIITGEDGVNITLDKEELSKIVREENGKYVYEGSFKTKQENGKNSTPKYTVTTTDEIDGTDTKDITVKFDGEAPKITIPANDITNSNITVTDSESGLETSTIVIKDKVTGIETTLNIPGTSDIDQAIKTELEKKGSGDYEITITSTDKVGNGKTEGPKDVYYEAKNDIIPDSTNPSGNKPANDGVVKLEFEQNPANNIFTNKDVMVNYTITSEVRLSVIVVDGVQKEVSDVAPNASGKYIYTGQTLKTQNEDVVVTYTTSSRGLKVTEDHAVTNIDQTLPEFDTNKFADNGSLMGAKGSSVHDIISSARSNDATSGIKSVTIMAVPSTGGAMISATSTASTVGSASTTFDDAIDSVIAKKNAMVNIYNVTVSITDNAGNINSYKYNNMTMTETTNPEQPTIISSDWEIQLVNDSYPKFIQLEIQATGSNKQAPRAIEVVQFNSSGAALSTTSLNVMNVNNGVYYTTSVAHNPSADTIKIIINDGTPISYTLPSNTQPSDINFGGLTEGDSYTGTAFDVIYGNIASNSSVTIISKTIRQYNTIALANSDTDGVSGTIKTSATSKTPLAKAKATRIVVTYEKGGSTYKEVSVPFYIKG